MSTVDTVFILNSFISHALNSGKKLYCSFIDLSKAFDYVVTDILWHKYLNIGVSSKLFDIIVSVYHNIRSRVKYNNCLTDSFSCQFGVRQGDCRSPFRFAINVNDIESKFTSKGANDIDIDVLKIFLLLNADDIVIFAESADDLHNSLDILCDYCQNWKLKVNIDKSMVITLKKGGQLRRNLSKYGNHELEIVSK